MVKSREASANFEPIETVDLVGGALCFDFTNTASGRAATLVRRGVAGDDLTRRYGVDPDTVSRWLREGVAAVPLRDRLRRYRDLVVWSERVGVVDAAGAERLRGEALRRPEDAGRVLERATELREAVYRIFSRIAAGEAAASADLDVLNAALTEGQALRRLVVNPRGDVQAGRAADYTWAWDDGSEVLASPLWPVAHSAAELLSSGDLGRVKECGGETCTWLFYDQSKNKSRRWCDMKDCGNRAKARRHYARKRSE